jgi:hypothetical protein
VALEVAFEAGLMLPAPSRRQCLFISFFFPFKHHKLRQSTRRLTSCHATDRISYPRNHKFQALCVVLLNATASKQGLLAHMAGNAAVTGIASRQHAVVARFLVTPVG